MPPSPESFYTHYRVPTGLLLLSLTLGWGLVGPIGSLHAAGPESPDNVLDGLTASDAVSEAQLDTEIAAGAASAQAPLKGEAAAAEAAGGVFRTDVSLHPTGSASTTGGSLLAQVPPSQGLLAQVPPAAASIPTGVPVPWQASPSLAVSPSQYPAAVPPGVPFGGPAGAPTGVPGGAWVMVWLPYSAPGGLPNASGVPPQGGQHPYSLLYPAWLPAAAPTGAPAGPTASGWAGSMPAPMAYPPMVYPPMVYPSAGVPSAASSYPAYPYPAPYGAYPVGTAPGVPMVAPFPSAAAPPAPTAFTQSQPGPYATVPFSTPVVAGGSGSPSPSLAVPALPANGSGAMLPPPPGQPIAVAPLVPPTALPAQPWAAPVGVAPSGPSLGSGPAPGPAVLPAVAGSAEPAAVAQTTASPTAPSLAPDPAAPLSDPTLNLQGLYVLQGGESSARARLNGSAFLTPNILVGGTLDVVTGDDLTSSDGIQLTELYLATALPNAPGLRFRLGQLDLTSYFDRNSFAKDIARDFFNPIFNTNPALLAGANVTASRPGGLVQWAVNDDITLSASAFSSAPGLSDFALDGFAGELSFRTGNLILRGTYLTSRDTEFQGTQDRLSAYGLNAELFIPEANLGLFGRYGSLNNTSTGLSADTFSLGINAFDLFMDEDRLGVAYGRNLSTASVQGLTPDALEVFYDFQVLPNIRMGLTFQQLNQFTESVAGFRIRSDFDLSPRPSLD